MSHARCWLLLAALIAFLDKDTPAPPVPAHRSAPGEGWKLVGLLFLCICLALPLVWAIGLKAGWFAP